MRKEDGRLHGRDEIVGTDGHSVEEASHSEVVVIIVNGTDILNLAHPDIFALVKNSGSSVRLTTALPDTAGPVFPVVSATLGRDFTMNRQYEASTTNADHCRNKCNESIKPQNRCSRETSKNSVKSMFLKRVAQLWKLYCSMRKLDNRKSNKRRAALHTAMKDLCRCWKRFEDDNFQSSLLILKFPLLINRIGLLSKVLTRGPATVDGDSRKEDIFFESMLDTK
ncbi:unnamed protein product [Caenorhabditis brenneri]